MDYKKAIIGLSVVSASVLCVCFWKRFREENVDEFLSVKRVKMIPAPHERKPFTELYTILISGKRYSGKQTIAEGLRKHFSNTSHNSKVFCRANVLGGPPVAGHYKSKQEVLKIYKDGMKQSPLFYAKKTLDMLYDHNHPLDKLVLIISDIRNDKEISFWKSQSRVCRTVFVDVPDEDRKERGWDGVEEDDYSFHDHRWDFTLENNRGNDIQKMINQLFNNSLLPSVEERAEISIITPSTVFSRYLHDYAYILATATQTHYGRVASVNVWKGDLSGVAIGSVVSCILQVPLTLTPPTHSDVMICTTEHSKHYDFDGPQIIINTDIFSYSMQTSKTETLGF